MIALAERLKYFVLVSKHRYQFYRGSIRGRCILDEILRSKGNRLDGTLKPDASSRPERGYDATCPDSVNPPSPYISLTSDLRVAEYSTINAGTTSKTTSTLIMKCGRAKQNKFNKLRYLRVQMENCAMKQRG